MTQLGLRLSKFLKISELHLTFRSPVVVGAQRSSNFYFCTNFSTFGDSDKDCDRCLKFQTTTSVIEEIVKEAVVTGNISRALCGADVMCGRGLDLPFTYFSEMFRQPLSVDEVVKALKLIRKLPYRDLNETLPTLPLNRHLFNLSKSGYLEPACQMLELYQNSADLVSCNILLYALSKGRLKEEAIQGDGRLLRRLIHVMDNQRVKPDAKTYRILIFTLCSRGLVYDAIRFTRRMVESGTAPTISIYRTLSGALFESNKFWDSHIMDGTVKNIPFSDGVINTTTSNYMEACSFLKSLVKQVRAAGSDGRIGLPLERART